MSVSAIRAQIKIELESITELSGITIHDYERRVDNWTDIEEQFKNNNRIHTWLVYWNTATTGMDTTFKGPTPVWQFQIQGFYSLKDASATEKTFDDISEAVFNHFSNLRRIIAGTRVVSLNIANDEVLFAGILCHRSTITLNVEERNDYS